MKINFSKTNYERLCELACEALFSNAIITGNMGQNYNIMDLLHCTSITTLNNIKAVLSKKIEKLESADEWVEADPSKLETARKNRELVNLIVGWKRYNLEIQENASKRAELTKKLTELKESTKTPEDRIKEMEAALAALDSAEEFK